MANTRLEYLFNRYFNKLASIEETDELMRLIQDDKNDEELRRLISETWQQTEPGNKFFTDTESQNLLQSIFTSAAGRSAATPVIHLRPRWLTSAVAASVVVILGLIVYTLYPVNNQTRSIIAKQPGKKVPTEIVPGSNTAFLTLSDGTIILLDTARNGNLTQQGNTDIIKIDGELKYDQKSADGNAAITYNSISTPRGGQYQVLLADGTRVWLNAASSLRFPTHFTGKQREVYLSGEAYFEVAKNTQQPFHVNVDNKIDVEVLGTRFNIMAYDDENSIKTTLVEGKVKIIKDANEAELHPNQQGVLDKSNSHLSVSAADVESAIAWKEGRFYFNDENIVSIMRKLSRWYDIDVEYQDKIPHEPYSGSIKRQAQIAQVLQLLEMPGGIQFNIEGRKVIVSPK